MLLASEWKDRFLASVITEYIFLPDLYKNLLIGLLHDHKKLQANMAGQLRGALGSSDQMMCQN